MTADSPMSTLHQQPGFRKAIMRILRVAAKQAEAEAILSENQSTPAAGNSTLNSLLNNAQQENLPGDGLLPEAEAEQPLPGSLIDTRQNGSTDDNK